LAFAAAIKLHLACEHVRLYMVDRETGDLIPNMASAMMSGAIIDHSDHLAKQVMHTRPHSGQAISDRMGM